MRIAVDISPIDTNSQSAHKVRGVGKYISLLRDNLERFDKKNTYIFTSNPEKEACELVHYPYFDPFFITLPIKKRIKTVVTVHDLIPIIHKENFPAGLKGNLKWSINRALLKRTDAIITDSEASKDDIYQVTGFNKSKISTVYLAADDDFKNLDFTEEEKANKRKSLNLPDKFILYVGDITWNKNLPRLIKAVQKINTPFVIVGKALSETSYDRSSPWNKDRVEVEKLTQDNPLFFKLGFISNEDLAKLYNIADLLCMPSLDEGFGLPVLEAMKSGCPVVTSRMGSLPEIVGTAGVYVDALSIDDIANGIKGLIGKKDLQEELSSKGIEQAKKFTLKYFITNTVKVYESITV